MKKHEKVEHTCYDDEDIEDRLSSESDSDSTLSAGLVGIFLFLLL